MNEESYDIVVAGDSVLAAFLGLFLAKSRRARICLVGTMPAPLQLLRDVTLSLGPYTRPETLALLVRGVDEVRALLAGRGETVLARRTVQFRALTPDGRAAAGHVRHMLAGFGAITSSLPAEGGVAGFGVEGVWSLRQRAFFAGLPSRLAALDIAAHAAMRDLQIGRDRVRFMAGNSFVSASRLVLVGAAAFEALGSLPEGLVAQTRTGFLTDPLAGLAGRLAIDVETGGHVLVHSDGRLEAASPFGEPERARAWLGSFLAPANEARVVATTRFPVLASRDGAPLVARIPRKAAVVVAGFGVSGAFLAPALARHLLLDASLEETAYFSTRTADANRSGIADIGYSAEAMP